MKSNFSVYTADVFKCKVHYTCNPDIILIRDRLFLDIKGHWETARMKAGGSECPDRDCIWWKESLQEDEEGDKEEEEGLLECQEEEGLLKSRPALDRRSPHSITSYQPHITHLICLPFPSHSSSFPHCPQTSSFLLSPPHLLHLQDWDGKFRYHSGSRWLYKNVLPT